MHRSQHSAMSHTLHYCVQAQVSLTLINVKLGKEIDQLAIDLALAVGVFAQDDTATPAKLLKA